MSKDKYWDRLPESDSEVNERIDSQYGENIAPTLKDIYRINRKKGLTVLDAFEETMKADLRTRGMEVR